MQKLNHNNLKKSIKDIVTTGHFTLWWSFHTLTFNIVHLETIKDINNLINTYIRWLQNLRVRLIQDFTYIYSFEISDNLHLHVHLLLNECISQADYKKLKKDFNNRNKWPWYNDRSLKIINSNEFMYLDVNESFLREILDDYKKDEFLYEKYKNLIKILCYITKSLFDLKYTKKLYYLIYPKYVFHGTSQNEHIKEYFLKYIRELNNIFLNSLYDIYNIYNPLLQSNSIENNSLQDIYNSWLNLYLKNNNNKEFYQLMTKLNKDDVMELNNKQALLEDFVLRKNLSLDRSKLYSLGDDLMYILNEKILFLINNKLKKQLIWLFFLEKKGNYIYYIIEGLVQLFKYYKEETILYTDIYNNDADNNDLENENEIYFTESYLKSILRNLYITNILNKNLIEYRNLYKNLDPEFICKYNDFILLLNDENISNVLNSVFTFELNKFNNITDLNSNIQKFYKLIHKELEGEIGYWLDLLLEVLYELELIIKIDKKKINKRLRNTEIQQNYFIISNVLVKELLINNSIVYSMLPMLIEPKSYDKFEFRGGRQKFLNILFSVNENIKYKMSDNRLDLINNIQKQSVSININYLNYLLRLPLSIIKNYIDLDFDLFNKYIKEHSDLKAMKKIPKLFLVYEFFLTILIADLFKLYDLWYPIKLDERGRKIDDGYPLVFQRDKVLRNLFIFNRSYVSNCLNEKLMYRDYNFDIYSKYLDKIIKNEKQYNIFNVLQNPLQSVVGFDASSQVYQIIGGLLFDLDLLHLSKVINYDPKNLYKNMGLYDYLLSTLKSELLNKESQLFKDILSIANNISKRRLSRKISFLFGNLDNILENIINVINRDWIKYIFMIYGYNKSIPGLVEDTFNKLFLNVFTSDKFDYKLIANKLVMWLITFFNTKWPSVNKLKRIFNNLMLVSISFDKPIFISIDNIDNIEKNGFFQYYYQTEYEILRKYRSYSTEDKLKYNCNGKYIKVYFPKIYDINESKKVPLIKNLKALLPNTSHYIDSTLMYNISYNLLKNNVPFKTLHDAYYTNIKYMEFIKESYINEYIILFEQNLLEKIILNAFLNFSITDKCKDLLLFANITSLNDLFTINIKKMKINKVYDTPLNRKLLKYFKHIILCYNDILKSTKVDFKELKSFILEFSNDDIIK